MNTALYHIINLTTSAALLHFAARTARCIWRSRCLHHLGKKTAGTNLDLIPPRLLRTLLPNSHRQTLLILSIAVDMSDLLLMLTCAALALALPASLVF